MSAPNEPLLSLLPLGKPGPGLLGPVPLFHARFPLKADSGKFQTSDMFKDVLIEFESSKNVVSFESSPLRSDLSQVIGKIKELALRNQYLSQKIKKSSTLLVQQYSEEFGCFIDVNEGARIPHHGKLKLIVEESDAANGDRWSGNTESKSFETLHQEDSAAARRRALDSLFESKTLGNRRDAPGGASLGPMFDRSEPKLDSRDRFGPRSSGFGGSDHSGPRSSGFGGPDHSGSRFEGLGGRPDRPGRFGSQFDGPGRLGSMFDGPEPMFDGPGSMFDGPGPLFDDRGPLFDDRGPMFDGPGPMSRGPGRMPRESMFGGRGPMFGGPGPMFDQSMDMMGYFDGPRGGPGFGNRSMLGKRGYDKGKRNDGEKYTWLEIMEWEEEELGFARKEPPNVSKIYEAAYEVGETSKQPVQMLNELAQRESWPMPKFEPILDGTNTRNPAFKFKVEVNGKTYKADRFSMNKKQAKVYAALKALYILKELF